MQIAGLEINGSKVALLALKKQGKILNIQTLAEKELPENTIVKGKLLKPEIFIQTLETLKKEGKPRKIATPYIILTLPEELIYLTVRPFPNINEDQIREALEINLREFVPGDPKEIFWGYQVLDNQSNKEILIASVQKSVLKDYLSSVTAAGFIPIAIEPASLSSLRAFHQINNTMLVEIDQKSVMVAIFDKLASRFSSGFAYDPKTLPNQIKKIANFYKAKKNLEKIDILMAGSQATDSMVSEIANNVGESVTLALDKMLFKNPNLKSPALLGAAMRGLLNQKEDKNLSLLPLGTAESYEEKRALHFIGGFANLITITCLLLILIFYGFWGLLYYLNYSNSQQLASVSKTVLDPEIAAIQKKMKDLEPKISYIKSFQANIKPVGPSLEKVKLATPANVNITNITQGKDSQGLTIIGNAQNRDALASFKDNLEKSNFSKVEITSTNVIDSSINFTLSLSYN